MKFRVAVAQMNSSVQMKENLLVAAEMAAEASVMGCRLLVLPEAFACFSTEKQKFEQGEIEQDSCGLNFLAATSARYGIYILGGSLFFRLEEEQRVRNCSLLFDDQGRKIAEYDKIHLFDAHFRGEKGVSSYCESMNTRAGTKIVNVELPFGNIGLSICFDLRFPELYQSLRRAGADIIAVPSAFTRTTAAHWETLLRARAIENQVYVLAANQWGLHENRAETCGFSQIIDPWGNVLARKGEGTGIVTAEIDFDYLAEIRRRIPKEF
jgi:nitrilase